MASRSSEARRAAAPGTIAILALSLVAALATALASTQPVARAASQPAAIPAPRTAAARAAERIRSLQREAEALASDESALLIELRRLEVERQIRVEELGQVARERADMEAALVAATARAQGLRQTAAAERPEIEARLVRVYKLGQGGFWRLLLAMDDLRSAGRAYRTASALSRIDRDRVAEHQHTLDALALEEANLRARMQQLGELEVRADASRVAADKAVAASRALIASIDARRDLNAQLTGELQGAAQRLQASVDRLGPGAAVVVLPIRAFQGLLGWPARGRVVARFGQASASRVGGNGIEIAVLDGQTVRSVHDGAVVYADLFSGYGNLVIVEHGDRTHSLYGYLSSLSVSKGDHVEAQAPVGASGLDPGGKPALYFELRVDGKAVDPLQWLLRDQA